MTERAGYVREKGALSLWDKKASPVFWQEHWHQLTDKELRHALRPTKYIWPSLRRILLKWLPKEGVVLDAGCGIGHMVQRLRSNGLSCIGLDYAVPSLIRSKSICPDLLFIGGDLMNLPFADDIFAGILSIGVLEHFEHGPGVPLREISRVLKPGGVVCLSVPFENKWRRNIPTISENEAVSRGLEFYQLYFKPSDLRIEVEKVGLSWLDTFSMYDVFKGFYEHTRWFKKITRLIPKSKYWSFLLDYIPILSEIGGHMIVVVAVKK